MVVIDKRPKHYYLIIFYGIAILIMYLMNSYNQILFIIYPFIFYLIIPLIESLVRNKKIEIKKYLLSIIKIIIAAGISYLLQLVIMPIKTGIISYYHVSNIMPSTAVILNIEYYIALILVLVFIALLSKPKAEDNESLNKIINMLDNFDKRFKENIF